MNTKEKIETIKEHYNQNNQTKISEHVEILEQLMKVHLSINKNIKSDYTLAMLNKEEKEFISENYQNAEYAKEIITRFGTKGYKYEYNEQKNEWIKDENGNPRKIPLNQEEKQKIEQIGERMFEFFMVFPHMIATLNRNKQENFMVKLLGNYKEEEKQITYGQDDRNILQKLKDKLTGKEKENIYEE